MTSAIIWEFANSFCVLFFVTYLFSRLKIIQHHLTTKPIHFKDKLILTLLFGTLGCVGSGIGIEFSGSLINTRVIGVALGGLLGGPMVGIFAGAIAAVHRVLFVDAGASTAIVCGVSMLFEGAFAGLLSRFSHRFKSLSPLALFTVICCEIFRKIMLLIFIKPFDLALLLVENMTVPMLFVNTLGVAFFVIYIENVVKEKEYVMARQSEAVLTMSEKISVSFKQGLIPSNLVDVVKTIVENTDFEQVFITDRSVPIISNFGDEALDQIDLSLPSFIKGAETSVGCFHYKQGSLHYLVAPLMDDASVAGFLLLGKTSPPNSYDYKLCEGLGKLFSAQLTLGNLEYQASLLKDAEIKLLQSQINPHFLFNTMTLISSLCRTDPTKARTLIDHLADFYRKNLRINTQLVSLVDEIKHTESYLQIIKARYDAKISVTFEIDTSTEDCFLPPISLQPLVENAIKHGILPKQGGGMITIRANRQPDLKSFMIEVEDDGMGFDPTGPSSPDSNAVGLGNVRQRLEKCFGDDLVWCIETQLNRGTKVTLIIPAMSMD